MFARLEKLKEFLKEGKHLKCEHFVKSNYGYTKATSHSNGPNVFKTLFQLVSSNLSTYLYLGRDARKPVFRVSDRARFKPISSATETS